VLEEAAPLGYGEARSWCGVDGGVSGGFLLEGGVLKYEGSLETRTGKGGFEQH